MKSCPEYTTSLARLHLNLRVLDIELTTMRLEELSKAQDWVKEIYKCTEKSNRS